MTYLTVQQHLRANAERHRNRAALHMLSMRPAWALGSLAKAEKSDRIADQFDQWAIGAEFDRINSLDAMAVNIAKNILGITAT